MPKSRALAVRLPVETWNRLSTEARRKGLTLSTLARTKLMLATEFEGPIQESIDDFSKRLGISRHEFLETIIIDFMARFSTQRDSDSLAPQHLLPQFVYTDRGLLRGRNLFEHMRAYYSGGVRGEDAVPAVARPIPKSAGEREQESPAGRNGKRVVRETAAQDHGVVRQPESPGAGSPGAPDLDRALIDQEMFDKIMHYYKKKGAVEEPAEDETEL
jgi:hypothetical protein